MHQHRVAPRDKGLQAPARLQQHLTLAERLHSTHVVQAPEYGRNKSKSKAMVWLSPPASSSGKFKENQRSDSNLKAAFRLEPEINSNNLTLLTPSLCDLCAAKVQINTLVKNRSSRSPGSRKR